MSEIFFIKMFFGIKLQNTMQMVCQCLKFDQIREMCNVERLICNILADHSELATKRLMSMNSRPKMLAIERFVKCLR